MNYLQIFDPGGRKPVREATSQQFAATALGIFVYGKRMHFTKRELLSSRTAGGPFAAVVVGLFLALLGAFGSYPALDPVVRYPFWIGLALAGYGCASVLRPFVTAAAPTLGGWPKSLVVAATSAVPMTFFAAWIIALVLPGRSYGLESLPILFLCVAATQCLIVGASSAITGDQSSEPQAGGLVATDVSYPASLLDRLPSHLRVDIYALESQDHYVKVYATNGSSLILMRFSDASAAIDDRLGLQVHRRWWVAESSVEAIRRDGSRLVLSLSSGLEVPVGRTYVASVRQRFGRLVSRANG